MVTSPTVLSRITALSMGLVLVGGAALAQVQPAPEKRPDVSPGLQVKINSAIDRGVESLLSHQALDGSWTQQIEGYGPGMTGLALYALMKSGLSPGHPAIERGFAFLERQEATKTYTRATVILALTTRGEKKDLKRVEELVEELVRSQDVAGWAYPEGPPDLSNTQFAVTALRAAAARGVSVPTKVWTRLVESTLECLVPESGAPPSNDPPRGFLYRAGHDHSTGSMTAAGVAILTICEEQLRRAKPDHSRAIKRGLAWLGEHFSVDFNPSPTAQGGQSGVPYYYLYGMERIGSMRGIETFGSYPWYQLGAEKLVELQKEDGNWDGQSDTAFALLFLNRATGSVGPSSGVEGAASLWTFGEDHPGHDVSLRASGRKTLTIWISSFGEKATFKYASGDDGKGPVPVERVEYWRVVPGAENERLGTLAIEDPAEGMRRRFAIQSQLQGPLSCEVFAQVFLSGREKPLESKPLKVRLGVSDRDTWDEYSTDHERNLLVDADVEVTASSASEGPRAQAINVIDGMVGLGWKPLPDDATPWIRLEVSPPASANTVLLSHGELKGALLGRYEVVINEKPKDAITGAMGRDVREKTVVTLPKTLRVRTIEIRFLDPVAANCTGLGEVELQRRR
ncbi:hypothetical protein Poly30_45090 [Planctomycetes bacterium Poly30]|uniref:F5/8 type C domain protein n=1 Tax=Saltatorellus ferox TaxID=2528018 RepID=A0A518EXZ9_9BACT|nr:hypothetical protein Poly30_45090 [Planctomycetes bacterium Poly30]